MANSMTLSCSSCGGQLQITSDIERFACAHCGTEHVVRRGGGIVSLAPVVEGLAKVEAGVDRTASELAIKRLSSEVGELESEYQNLQRELRSQSRPSGCSVVAVGGGIITLITIATGASELALRALVLVLVSIAFVVLAERSRAATRRRLESQVTSLGKQIDEKKSELKQHEDVVSL